MYKSRLNALLPAALLVLGSVSTTAMAADGAELYKSKLCVTCHGEEGKKPIAPGYPKLAGQDEKYLLDQSKYIKAGTRSSGLSSAMMPMVQAVTEEELAAISAYLSGVTP